MSVVPAVRRLQAGVTVARTITWLPVLTAVAYLVVVAVKFPAIVRAVSWNSDIAGAYVLSELVPGDGTIEIPRFGFWSSFWWLLATREVPGHAHLWEGTGYAFALGTVALVGWATYRVAGRWAGVTAATVAIVVGPRALTFLATVNSHTSTPFTAAVLAAYLVVLTRSRSWLLPGAVGVFAGVNAASDPLLWIAGLAPFAVAAAMLVSATKARVVAGRAGLVLGLAVVCAVTTDGVMHRLGFHVIPVGLERAGLSDLGTNFVTLGKSIASVFGANYFVPPATPGVPIRYVLTLLAFAAVAAGVVSAVHLTFRRSEPTLRAFASFWATGAVLLSVVYWGSNQAAGAGSIGGLKYLLTLAPAAGVGVGLLSAASSNRRIAGAAAVAFVGAVNAIQVAHGRAEERTAAEIHGPQLIALLEEMGLQRGYAGYWDAHALTWKSGMRLLVAPVQLCDAQRPEARDLCRHPYFTIDSWYEERPGASFVVVNPVAGMATPPPREFGRPLRVLRPADDVAVYVYPYDVARHIGDGA